MWPTRNALLLLTTLQHFHPTHTIVNPHQESANMVIYLRPPHELGPRTWQAGVNCLDNITQIFFYPRERLGRAYNIVLSSSFNMSTPAAQIQDRYLKLLHETVSERASRRRIFQIRVIFDSHPYVRLRVSQRDLIYSDYYVIIVDSVERLRKLMREYISRMSSFNPGARFLIFYNNVEQHDMKETISKEIFKEMIENYYAHRIGLLYATADMEYSFDVLDYYNRKSCRSLRAHHIGKCRDGQPYPNMKGMNQTFLLFVKNHNVRNCTFYMCAAIGAPFVEADCNTGIEMRLVNFIHNRLRTDIERSCEYENRGVLTQNGSWSGLLGKLNDRHCDFILGGFYPDNEVSESFWSSDCYLSDSHTWFVKLADPRPAWIALYAIFQPSTWLAFLGMLVVSCLVWYFFVNMLPEPESHKQFSLAAINAMAVSICAAVYERPECQSSRLFFIMLSIYGMNVASTYTSQLISVFTNPGYLHQIDNLNEVVEADIPFGGSEESRDWFENEQDMWIFDKYNDSSLFEPHNDNLLAVKRGLRVILSSRMYILQNALSDEIYAFPKNVFNSPLQLIMKPGFPLLYEINWLIRYMRDQGIFTKINNDFVYNNTYLNRIDKMRPEYNEAVIVLRTDHLQGPFAILMVGVISSTLCFIAELLVYWCLGPYLVKFFGWNLYHKKTLKRGKKKATLVKVKPVEKKMKHGNQKQVAAKKKIKDEKKKQKKEKVDDNTLVFRVDVVRDIRFTPLKRRRIVIK